MQKFKCSRKDCLFFVSESDCIVGDMEDTKETDDNGNIIGCIDYMSRCPNSAAKKEEAEQARRKS